MFSGRDPGLVAPAPSPAGRALAQSRHVAAGPAAAPSPVPATTRTPARTTRGPAPVTTRTSAPVPDPEGIAAVGTGTWWFLLLWEDFSGSFRFGAGTSVF